MDNSNSLINTLEHIQTIIQNNKFVLFMKGTKDFPQCHFSALAVQILNFYNVEFKDVNVLSSEDLRSAIKQFSEWPTIPQFYADKLFIGGSDILQALHKEDKLRDLLQNNK